MGTTSRYSRNRASSASVSNCSISSSSMGRPLWRPEDPLDRVALEARRGPQSGLFDAPGDVPNPLERPAMDGARPVELERVPVSASPVATIGVESVHREPPVVAIHGPVPGHLGHDGGR